MSDYTPHRVVMAVISILDDNGEPVDELDVHIDSHLLELLRTERYPNHVPYLRDAVVWMLNSAGTCRMSFCAPCGNFHDVAFDPGEPGSMLNDAFVRCPECAEGYTPPPPAPKYTKQPIPHNIRRAVLERDAYRCQECGDWHNLSIDHIHPESKGGAMALENLRALCRTCNSRKGAKV